MPTAMQYQILIIHYSLEIYVDIYNSQLRYGFRYLVYLVSPLLLERLTSISILLYQFEGQAYVYIHNTLIFIRPIKYIPITIYK